MTEQEHPSIKGDSNGEDYTFIEWRRRCHSKEYCLSKVPSSGQYPTEEALPEAQRLLEEQRSAAEGSSVGAFDEVRNLSANAHIEQYAFALYTTENFENWHRMEIRSFYKLPARKPTQSERLRFEILFYQILRYVVMKYDRFESEMRSRTFTLAEINRLENFFGFFIQCVGTEHDSQALFRTPHAAQVYARIESIRSERGRYWFAPTGWCNMEWWAIFDDVQPALEYDCTDDPSIPEPVPRGPWG